MGGSEGWREREREEREREKERERKKMMLKDSGRGKCTYQ